MSGIGESRLRDLARFGEIEWRMARDGDETRIDGAIGSLGGRMMRNLKIAFGEDREDKQAANRDMKLAVRQSLVEIYGEDIGERAFRAGVGHLTSDGKWDISVDHPLTGRHVAKMLQAADEELAQRQPIADWMGEVLDDPSDSRHALLGGKASVALPGRIAIGDACRGLAADLHADAEKRFADDGPRHGFWVMPLALKGRIDGQDMAEIAFHIDRQIPGMVDVRDVDGRSHAVPQDELGQWLEDYNRTRLAGRAGSMALFRLEEGFKAPAPDPLDNNLFDTGSDGAIVRETGRHDAVSDLLLPDPILLDVDSSGDAMSDPVVVDLRTGSANLRGLLGDRWDAIVEDHTRAIAGDVAGVGGNRAFSERLNERIATGTLALRSGDGEPQRLMTYRQIMFGITDPNGEPLLLRSPMPEALTRFLDDTLLHDVYRGMFEGRDPDTVPNLDQVEFQIRTHWGDGRMPVFDITLRARMPEGMMPEGMVKGMVTASDRDLPPEGLDLTLTLHVTRDEMSKPQPQFIVDDPRLEPHRH
ncbi:MAG: hypothetical protein WDN25_11465 [Acetobacteraceae bacterium]